MTTENAPAMSIKLAEVAAERLDKEQNELHGIVADYVIEDDTDYELAAKTLQIVKGRIKEVEAERTSLVKPLRDVVTKLNSYFSPATDKLEGMAKRLDQLMRAYQLKKRDEQQKLLAAAAVEAAKQKVTDVDPPKAAMTLMKAAQSAAPPTVKGTSVTEVIKWEYVDDSLVPHEFCSPDVKKINAAVRAGVKEIPGIRIYADVQISSRASK